MNCVSKRPAARGARARGLPVGALAGLLSLVAPALAGATASTFPFSVELDIVNQCTGEATTVTLDGKVIVQTTAHGYSVQSHVNGTATGDTSGARFHFNGVERADYESETPDAELVIFNNVRMHTKGGQAAFLGYDEQTISIDGSGAISNVAHRFDFTCD